MKNTISHIRAFLSFLFLIISPTLALANVVYDWVGTCADNLPEYVMSCSGEANGRLELEKGNPFNFSYFEFVSWDFSSSVGSFSVSKSSSSLIARSWSVDEDIFISGDISSTKSAIMLMGFPGEPVTPEGYMWMAAVCPVGGGSCSYGTYGSSYTFIERKNELPEPSTLLMALAAFGLLLGLSGRCSSNRLLA